MTTPSEFKKIKDLRQIDDAGIKPDLFMLLESDLESTKVLLSQLAAYIREPLMGSIVPAGVPMPWAGATPPPGHVFINDGYTFDIVKYPLLALAWPNGIIPPHKGLVIECTADGAITGAAEQGQVKSHKHSNDHGHNASFEGNKLPNHSHQFNKVVGESGGRQSSGSANWTTDNKGRLSVESTSAGTPSGTVTVDDHIGSTGETGGSRNTVDRINYNMMVRLA